MWGWWPGLSLCNQLAIPREQGWSWAMFLTNILALSTKQSAQWCGLYTTSSLVSGRSRNLERGVKPLAHEVHSKIFWLPHPLPVRWRIHNARNYCSELFKIVQAEYLEATLGLLKRLEISKELIRECVTVPGCCCYMRLLHIAQYVAIPVNAHVWALRGYKMVWLYDNQYIEWWYRYDWYDFMISNMELNSAIATLLGLIL